MKIEILATDLLIVEQVLAKELKQRVNAYDNGDTGIENDTGIADLQRALKAIGRPYSIVWDSRTGRTDVSPEK